MTVKVEDQRRNEWR